MEDDIVLTSMIKMTTIQHWHI